MEERERDDDQFGVEIANGSFRNETFEMEEREVHEGRFGIATHDYFPNDTFEREEAEMDDDEISEGSEGGDDNDRGE